jgi:hypothetical protein
LNDRTELIHLRDDLTRAVQDRVRAELLRLKLTNPLVAKALAKANGAQAIAREEATNLVDVIYQTTFQNSTIGTGFAVPYITSFCSHQKDHQYEKQNGLLSQWRGYGGDERYAIVFQTDRLEKLLEQEAKIFLYPALIIGDVIYNDENVDFARRYASLIDSITTAWASRYDGSNTMKAEATFQPFVMAATRMKHRGFKEEREIRIIACPTFKDFNERLHTAAQMPIAPGTKYKEAHRRRGENRPDAEYLSLFDWRNGKRLPIARIIVGPHHSQAALKRQVESLTNRVVPVVCSQTPFIG